MANDNPFRNGFKEISEKVMTSVGDTASKSAVSKNGSNKNDANSLFKAKDLFENEKTSPLDVVSTPRLKQIAAATEDNTQSKTLAQSDIQANPTKEDIWHNFGSRLTSGIDSSIDKASEARQDELKKNTEPVVAEVYDYTSTPDEEWAAYDEYLKTVDGSVDPFAWKMPNGMVIGYDLDGNHRVSVDEIDPTLAQRYLDEMGYVDDEISIGTKGYSTLGPNTWDQAFEQGLITEEELENGKASGQTYLDGRFGDLYKVKRQDGNQSDKYSDLSSDYYDTVVMDGGLVDYTSYLADMNAQRRLQNDIREMSKRYNDRSTDDFSEWIDAYGDGFDMSTAEGYQDAWNSYVGKNKESLTEHGNEVRTDETDPYVLDVVTQEVLPGEAYTISGESPFVARSNGIGNVSSEFPSFEEWFAKNGSNYDMSDQLQNSRAYADYGFERAAAVGQGDWLEDSDFAKSKYDEDDSFFDKVGKFFGSSTSASGDGTFLSDLVNGIGNLLTGAEGAIRDLPNSNDSYIIDSGMKYDVDDVNRESNKFIEANGDMENLAQLLYNIYTTKEEAVDAYNDLYGTNYNEHAFEFMPRNAVNIYDNDGNFVYQMTASNYDPDVLLHDEWLDPYTREYIFPNGTRVPYDDLYEVTDNGYNIHTQVTYDDTVDDGVIDYTPILTVGLDGSVPYTTLLGLMNGSILEQKEKGLGGAYGDIIGEDGLDVGAMLTHPGQTAAFAADTFMDSLPYMLPKGIGAAFGLLDVANATRGVDPWSYNSSTGAFADPGLQTKGDYRNNIANTALESGMEYLLGHMGHLPVGKALKKATTPKTWEQAAAKAMKPDNKLKKFIKSSGANTLEEGVEESLTSLAQSGAGALLGSPTNLNVVKNEDGTTRYNAWGGVMYDEDTSTKDRVGNLTKELIDSFIGGSLVGAPLSVPHGLSSAAETKTAAEKMREMGYRSPGLTEEELNKILEDLDNTDFEEAF